MDGVHGNGFFSCWRVTVGVFPLLVCVDGLEGRLSDLASLFPDAKSCRVRALLIKALCC